MGDTLQIWIAAILAGVVLHNIFPPIPAWVFTLGVRIAIDVALWLEGK